MRKHTDERKVVVMGEERKEGMEGGLDRQKNIPLSLHSSP